MKLIDVKNMEKVYKKQTIKHESITVQKRITILKGENGSGKSTLIKSILGLIHYNGTIDNKLECGYFPESMKLPNHLKVETFLKMMLPLERLDAMHQLITLFDMHPHLDKEIGMLSKGMHMKCRLIYTLSLLKDIYFLDEPFNGLDEEALVKLCNYIKKHEKMFLISTHLDVFQRDFETDVYSL